MFYTHAVPLHVWRRNGAFNVISCTKKEIVIEAAGIEIGMALLADTEYLLDHAAEHRAIIFDIVTSSEWHSPAWAVVTSYYWAFYSALALTRLVGESTWFLDRNALTELKVLAGATEQPGAGALHLSVMPYNTATTRTIKLHPTKAQLHDSVWMAVQQTISDVFTHTNEDSDSKEYRLWLALKSAGNLLGSDWASKLRNAVNYRSGCGYREVIRSGEIDFARHLWHRTPATMEDLIGSFEDEIVKISPRLQPAENVKEISRLLGLYSILMTAIVSELHYEVLDRQGGDQRWSMLRARFFAERCSSSVNKVWPFSD